MKWINVFVFFVTVFIGTSCDPLLKHSKIIHNRTDTDLVLKIENPSGFIDDLTPDTIYYTDDSTTMIYEYAVPSNSDKVVLYFEQIGVTDNVKGCGILCETMYFDTTNVKVTKAIEDLDNWTRVVEDDDKGDSGIVNCYFEINSGDIENP